MTAGPELRLLSQGIAVVAGRLALADVAEKEQNMLLAEAGMLAVHADQVDEMTVELQQLRKAAGESGRDVDEPGGGELVRLRAFARWVASLDEAWLASDERRTVTLSQIVNRAVAALSPAEASSSDGPEGNVWDEVERIAGRASVGHRLTGDEVAYLVSLRSRLEAPAPVSDVSDEPEGDEVPPLWSPLHDPAPVGDAEPVAWLVRDLLIDRLPWASVSPDAWPQGKRYAHEPLYRRPVSPQDAGELAEVDHLGAALTELRSEANASAAEVKRLQKVVDEMAQQLAVTVRWGMGPNLQSKSARSHLELQGYTIDEDGWLSGEAGYTPPLPPAEAAAPSTPACPDCRDTGIEVGPGDGPTVTCSCAVGEREDARWTASAAPSTPEPGQGQGR